MKKIQILLLIFLFSCNATKKNSETVIPDQIKVLCEQHEGSIVFELRNLNKQTVFYVKKNVLEIERLLDEEWTRVRILPCPCDAPCREFNREIPIGPNDAMEIEWNMIESWCGTYSGVELVRETISKKVEKGLYRIKLSFRYDDGEKFQEIKEFTIN